MENHGRQSTFLAVVGIATLLVAIVGATFAYFSITVSGNETASSIQVQTAVLGNVIFLDGDNVSATNIYPGWYATKNFTVSNDTPGATQELPYEIRLEITVNTITDAAEGAFVYNLSGTSSNDGTVITAVNVEVPVNSENVAGTGILKGTDTHTYTFRIVLSEMSNNQNAAQGKAFAGVIQVKLLDGGGKYTWDKENSTSSVY